MLRIKRAYEKPDPADGLRIMVDRLCPRSLAKENAKNEKYNNAVVLKKYIESRVSDCSHCNNRMQRQCRMAIVYVLQHIHCETLGIISECLKTAGIFTRSIRTFDGEKIPPSMNRAEGLVVMGGPMGVYDQQQFPFLLEEQRLIEQALKEEKPVLGVCLGSQLLAATLGAEVKKGRQKEIGWHRLSLNGSAASDPFFIDVESSFIAYHWHGDVYDLPRCAMLLASSELTPCQAFRYGETAYGFLFHMEVTEQIINDMVGEFQEELDAENIEAETIIQQTGDYLQNLQSIGAKVFGRWAKLIKIV